MNQSLISRGTRVTSSTWKRRLIAGLLPCLIFCVEPVRGQEPAGPPPVPKTDAMRVPYWGEITQIAKKSITVQSPILTATPMVFELSEDLMAGKVPNTPRALPGRLQTYKVFPSYMYRLDDVHVGDLVSIEYAHIGGRVICDHICIQKRPGGRVPPLPDEAEALRRPPPLPPGIPPTFYIPYHERMNAHWDLVDHRIPYPEHFGPLRKFPPPLPLAPPPREVNRTPAAP